MAASGRAAFFDGQTSRRHDCEVRLAAALEVVEKGQVIARWPYGDVRELEAPPGTRRFRSISAAELARLEIADAAFATELERVCRRLYEAGGAEKRMLHRIVFWSLAAVASMVAVVLYGLPLLAGQLAAVVPGTVEVQIGEAVDGQVKTIFGGKECQGLEGKRAFAKLVARIEQQAPARVTLVPGILDSPVANAFALPGGRIYVLRGLLDKAETEDELAGVIAHEVGHVVHRHGLKRLIQAGGSSFLLGLFFGDVFGAGAIIYAARELVDSAYSRDSEREADDHAATVMLALGRSGAAFTRFLERVEGKNASGGLPVFFRSHPLTKERIERLSQREKPVTGPPILSSDEWAALKRACRP